MFAAQEDQFPMGCDWIAPLSAVIPYVLAIAGVLVLAVLAHDLVASCKLWREIIRERASLED